MRISEFATMDINDRINLVWNDGTFIDKFTDTDHVINLYFLDNFYVEITVNKSDQEISEIFAFKKSVRLEKYLNRINLKNLGG